jgi:hypothetical protein
VPESPECRTVASFIASAAIVGPAGAGPQEAFSLRGRRHMLGAEHLPVQVLAVAGRKRLALGQPEGPLPVGPPLRAQEQGLA